MTGVLAWIGGIVVGAFAVYGLIVHATGSTPEQILGVSIRSNSSEHLSPIDRRYGPNRDIVPGNWNVSR